MNRKILVVDDKGINRYMLGEIFRDQYEVLEAAGGAEAIEMIAKEKDELAIVLLDIIMPGVNGFDVLAYMKEHQLLEDIPVIVVTDDSTDETAGKAFAYKVADMVIKPYEPRIIKRRVQNIIELYTYRRELRRAQ
ncbi:MAG: response regulator [Lachnospiraceae bacterium]|nr:response regulator [Lachnospiraceae bacterium]